MRVASRAWAISSTVLAAAASNTMSSAALACGSICVRRPAMSQRVAARPAIPDLAAARAVTGCRSASSASTTSSAAMTRSFGQHVGRALRVPCRRHDQAGFAVARQDDGRGSQGLEAAQHEHRIGGLDEMRAVVDGDDEVELVLDHAGADGGEAFVEGHGVFPGLIRRLAVSIHVQIPSGPPASPRSVSANSASSGSIRLIMPCWWV